MPILQQSDHAKLVMLPETTHLAKEMHVFPTNLLPTRNLRIAGGSEETMPPVPVGE